jgi:hypothetical protein
MNDTQRGGLSYCLTGAQCLMATFGQTFVQVYWPKLEGRGFISRASVGRQAGSLVSQLADRFF